MNCDLSSLHIFCPVHQGFRSLVKQEKSSVLVGELLPLCAGEQINRHVCMIFTLEGKEVLEEDYCDMFFMTRFCFLQLLYV